MEVNAGYIFLLFRLRPAFGNCTDWMGGKQLKPQFRLCTAAGLLVLCLLAGTGCSILPAPRIERDINRVNLMSEWEKIGQHIDIDPSQAMLSDLIIRYDARGTLTSFYFNFFVKETEQSCISYSAQFTADNSLKYKSETITGAVSDAIRVETVFRAIDTYGFRRLQGEITGDVGIMLSTVWGKTCFRSDAGYLVYRLVDGEPQLVQEQTFDLGAEWVALNVWEEGKQNAAGRSLVYILQDGPEDVPAAAPSVETEPEIN